MVFSPNTLRKATDEQMAMADTVVKKKHYRKRGNNNNKKGASQPLPKRIRGQDAVVVPSTQFGLPRVHVAGDPILTPDMIHIAVGAMLTLHEGVKTLEALLLKEDDPNYPVFTAKVPLDVGFVDEPPADIFFIAFEDIFKLFLMKRLDYNLVRLYALNLALTIKRESTPKIAIVDPYYMRDSQLVEGSETRTKATAYLEKFMVDNKRKGTLLLPFFPE